MQRKLHLIFCNVCVEECVCVCGQILKIKEWGKGEALGAQENEPRLGIIYIFGPYWMVKGGGVVVII